MNDKTFKDVFDKKINKNDIYNHVLNKKVSPIYLKPMILACTCFILIFTTILLLKPYTADENHLNIESANSPTNPKHKIIVNQISIENDILLDLDVKTIRDDSFLDDFDFIHKINLDNMFKKDCFIRYVRGESEEYNQIESYIIAYTSKSANQGIQLTFSKNNYPLRCIYFGDKTNLGVSNINNQDVIIISTYKYNLFQFYYDGIYFDIETNNISINEVIRIIESIIK